jgi:hypothetical protein
MERLQQPSRLVSVPQQYSHRRNCCFLLWRMLETIVVLALTGIFTAVITLIANLAISYFSPVRYLIVSSLGHQHVLACLVRWPPFPPTKTGSVT